MNCLLCGKSKNEGKKYCSKECYWKSKIGKKHWWGYKIGNALRGVPKDPEYVKRHAEQMRGQKRPSIAGENSIWWKGSDVSYGGLHDWIRLQKGLAKKCDHCGKKGQKSGKKAKHWTIHWASKSRTYKRDLNDWLALCRKCHYQYDIK